MSFQNIPDFHRIILQDKKLRIPKKYVENFWKRISNPIFLKFPNGVQQKIFWVESNGDIWFQKNWESFAKFLKYGYLLTFKYIGGSYFKVKIFSANTLEINYSNIKSVEEVVEATEKAKEGVEVSGDSDKSLDDGEIPTQAQRTRKNGKRKNSVDLDTTQPIFSDGDRGGMVKKAKKCSPVENPFFDVTLPQSYAHGCRMVIPSDFSRAHLNKFKGIANLRVGEDMTMKVDVMFEDKYRRSVLTTGWKSFNQKYNLQVGDKCKFVMTQREPLSFTVTINPSREQSISKKLKSQGYKEGTSSFGDNPKRKGFKGTSRSCPTNHLLESRDSGGMIKKAKNCSPVEVVIESDNIENPFFYVTLSKSYVHGSNMLVIPCNFSRAHLNKFKGIANLRVGEDKTMEVNVTYEDKHRRSLVTTGWKSFNQKYNLQVGDKCKFAMTQREPLSFTVTITPSREQPSLKKFKSQGYKEGTSSCGDNLKRKGFEGTFRSCPTNHLENSEGDNVKKPKTFKIDVYSKYPNVPKEFMKRGSHENFLELKMGGRSWFVKVNFYDSIHGYRFSGGWRKFIKECKVEIGDTLLFKLIDESKFVFDVSIVGKNPLAVCSIVL